MTNQDINKYIKIYKNGNKEVFNDILKYCEKTIYSIISKYKTNTIYSKDDLYQVSSIGLLKALDKFDFTKGIQFKTYASKIITNELNVLFRDARAKKRSAIVKSLDYTLDEDDEITTMDTIKSELDTEEIIMQKVEKEFILDYLEYCKEKTPRRYEQVELLLKGYNTLEVAEILECSHQTISQNFKRFCKGIKEKAIMEGIVEI